MLESVPAPDFTVGWVCALPIELAAATEMMDQEFADMPAHPTDSNIYSFGRIGKHNVVAACLPAGQMGTNQAATVASQMRISFPSLRFGLLVGIGGGVPNLDDDIDIRLGDVVISQPTGQHSGVIQYDFGKTVADGRIVRIGNLNAPPTILLNAVPKLRANNFRGKTQVLNALSQLSSWSKFASPGPEEDILYHATTPHMTGATCANCSRQNIDIVDREARTTMDPVLFFGNIASGNQVIKDGSTRNRYSRELGGVLCFEMEAAGLMNNFSCIVIRGICDYADAHKNKRWQPYAAATAAAYAKELLSTIPPLVPRDLEDPGDSQQKPQFLVPFGRNENFVGRDAILTQLLKRIPPSTNKDACQRTAIRGLGGIGKTQVAIEAAYRVRDLHPECSVFWVPAMSTVMFENAYRGIGRALSILGIEDNQADVKSLVKAALERDEAGYWLLIVDNADDIELLFNSSKLITHLPSTSSRRGSILLTTRNGQVPARWNRTKAIDLQEMDTKEATKLFCSGLDEFQISDYKSTTQLLKHLACLPLAIQQASAYMASNKNVTTSSYLGFCNSSNDKLIRLLSKNFDDQDRYEIAQNPVATTWLISFEQISRDNPLAVKYLRFMCYLAEKDIPTALLPPGEDDFDQQEAIGILMAYAFIFQRDAEDRFDVHRLVRLVMRNWLKEQGREEEQATETITWLSSMFPWPHHGNREAWMAYLPHIQVALEVRGWSTDNQALSKLLSYTGKSESLLGRFSEVEQMYREALEIREKILGLDDPETLGSIRNLALVLRTQEKYEEAEQLHRRTLKLMKRVLGPDSLDTLSSMNNLAVVLSSQEKYEEAEQIHRQTISLMKKTLGPDDLSTLRSMNNLAVVLSSQEKYEEAEELHRQTLDLREKVLGPESLDTLGSMNNLAVVLRNQGKYKEAEQMHRQTLRMMEKGLGPEDPSTLCVNNSVVVLNSQGKYEEAEQMYRQTLELKEKILGLGHPLTVKAQSTLMGFPQNPTFGT
ncbi:Kinesin light chain 4 [Colletotrichum chlorophyti]|uniref:Kinesin light chain 4 n=1 Tax=Colletotrichum chlorophyti TaxID=708187 RepID=A0A1Q8S298_9PEZI|nr:Kinesin light chain 4 [Colletotrichum chlorophyti]